MQLHTDALFGGIGSQGLPELVVAGVLGVDTGIHADPAIVIAVPLIHHLHQLLALLIGLKVEILTLVDEAVGGEAQVGLDAGFGHRFRSGVGVVVQVGYGGDTEAQTLGNGQQGRGLGAPGVHFGLLLQQGFQGIRGGQIIRQTSENCGGQMGVAVDKTGNGHHAGAVNDGLWLLLGGMGLDGLDLSVLNGNICPEQHIHSGIHGNCGYICDQCIQIVILPFRRAVCPL